MKKSLLLWVVGWFVNGWMFAQDPILMRINDKVVHRSEFEYAYNKEKSEHPSPLKVNDFLTHFVADKLKIAEAEALGLTTTSTFRSKLAVYRKQLSKDFFMDKIVEDIFGSGMIEQNDTVGRPEQVVVVQIFKSLPQNSSSAQQEAANQLMQSLYSELMKNPEADFSAYVEKYSDDTRTYPLNRMQTPLEFEQVIFSLKKDEISTPFFTPLGIHIVKVIDVRAVRPYEDIKEEWRLRGIKRLKTAGDRLSFLLGLKEQNQYEPNQDRIHELFTTGKADGVLFTLKGKAYTSEDFSRFAIGNPQGIELQFEDYVTKSVLECEDANLEKKYPEFRFLMQKYWDKALLSEITEREIEQKISADKAGLMAYFAVNKKKYQWKSPRFSGIIVHARDKKSIRQVKKLLKKTDMKKWNALVEEKMNTGDVPVVQVEQGLFSEGDNRYVDKIVFKKGGFVPYQSYPYTEVIGKKVKGPESYEEVLLPLSADYRKFLESLWLSRLRKEYRVEINEEVLKTVNKY